MAIDWKSLSFDHIVENWSKYKDEYVKTDQFNKMFTETFKTYNMQYDSLEGKLRNALIINQLDNPILESYHNYDDYFIKQKIKTCKRLHLHYKISGKFIPTLDIYMPTNWQWNLTPPNPVEYEQTVMKYKTKISRFNIHMELIGITVLGLFMMCMLLLAGVRYVDNNIALVNNTIMNISETHKGNTTNNTLHQLYDDRITNLEQLVRQHKQYNSNFTITFGGILISLFCIMLKIFIENNDMLRNEWSRQSNTNNLNMQQKLDATTNFIRNDIQYLNNNIRDIIDNRMKANNNNLMAEFHNKMEINNKKFIKLSSVPKN